MEAVEVRQMRLDGVGMGSEGDRDGAGHRQREKEMGKERREVVP